MQNNAKKFNADSRKNKNCFLTHEYTTHNFSKSNSDFILRISSALLNFKGFVFADVDGDTFATQCTNSWDHDMEFGIFSSNW